MNKLILALLVTSLAACSRKPADEARAAGTRPPAGSPVAADPANRGAGAGGGAPGARRTMSATLAATDVATVTKAPIERAISITGELRPIDRVEIRARLEGDLTDVYVREGQRVGAGALLAKFESFQQESAKASAEAERAAARSALQTAQWNLDQSKELFKEGAIPERDMRAADSQLASARAQLAAAESHLRTALSSFTDTRVMAPVTGVIETRSVSPGEHLARGAMLFSLVRNDLLELAASVPAGQASSLRTGQTIRFSAVGQTVLGKVARISPTVDPVSRAVTVYVQVPNRDGTLRGGTFATARLVLGTDTGVITIPSTAVRFSAADNSQFAYRIVNGELERAPIQVGYSDESAGFVEVLAGLNVGDKIVVGNVGTLGNGMKVQIIGGDVNKRGGQGGRTPPSGPGR